MSEFGISPNFAYDTLRGRNFCRPFTSARRFSNDFTVFPLVTFDLGKTKTGYETIFNKFVVMFDFGPFGTPNVLRCGLRANGRLMDGYDDACFNPGESGFGTGNQMMRSNGFVPAAFINGLNDFNFLYRAPPDAQISCVIEQYDPTVVIDQQRGVIFVSGAQLAA